MLPFLAGHGRRECLAGIRQGKVIFSETAQFYDAICAAFKDYAAEAAGLTSRLRDALPGARTILDVGCGTGEHARRLQVNYGLEVDGLDLDPALRAAARLKLPNGRFFEADMAAFDLGRRYDAATCLFRPEEVLACFREAGLAAEFDPVGLTGRGFCLARAVGAA